MKPWPLLLLLLPALFVLGVRSQVLGDVVLYTDNYTFDPFPDLPADFGPDVPDEGIDGFLRVADPEDACSPLSFRIIDETWVALISRAQQAHPTNCTFDVKVRNAELAGASAAIVYDDTYEALIIMSKPRDHPDPGIPAVFVSEKAGIIMRKLITPGATRVRIVAVSASAWMSLVMSAFLGFMALTVVLATFYVMRSWSVWLGRTHGRRPAADMAGGGPGGQATGQEGLPACAIHALPVLVYEGKASRRRRSKSATPYPSVAAATTTAGAGGPGAAAGTGAAMPGASAWVQGGPTSTVIGGVGSRLAPQGVGMMAGIREGTATVATALEQVVPGATAYQQQEGSLTRPCQPVNDLSSSRSNGLPCAWSPAAAAAAAGPAAAAPGSPAASDMSSPLLSTDDDDEAETEEAVLASSSSVGQHCIITAGPVGARGGATRRTCVVCLERYQTGDTVRVLPCQHRFHSHCIDLWLASRRLCPVCKHDASIMPQLQPAEAAAVAGAAGVSGRAAAAADDEGPDAADGIVGGAAASAPDNAGLLFLGHRYWFTRLTARLSRAGRVQQAAPEVAAEAANASRPVLPTQPMPEAAEAGLLPVSHPAALPADTQQQQQQWAPRTQRVLGGRSLLWQRRLQRHQQRGELGEPLLSAATDLDGQLLANALGASVAAANTGDGNGGSGWLLPASAAVPIPQLTPVHSDAASSLGGSLTPNTHSLRSAHSMV